MSRSPADSLPIPTTKPSGDDASSSRFDTSVDGERPVGVGRLVVVGESRRVRRGECPAALVRRDARPGVGQVVVPGAREPFDLRFELLVRDLGDLYARLDVHREEDAWRTRSPPERGGSPPSTPWKRSTNMSWSRLRSVAVNRSRGSATTMETCRPNRSLRTRTRMPPAPRTAAARRRACGAPPRMLGTARPSGRTRTARRPSCSRASPGSDPRPRGSARACGAAAGSRWRAPCTPST